MIVGKKTHLLKSGLTAIKIYRDHMLNVQLSLTKNIYGLMYMSLTTTRNKKNLKLKF